MSKSPDVAANIEATANPDWLHHLTNMSFGSGFFFAATLGLLALLLVWFLQAFFKPARDVPYQNKWGKVGNSEKQSNNEPSDNESKPPQTENKPENPSDLSEKKETLDKFSYLDFYDAIYNNKNFELGEKIILAAIQDGIFSEEYGRSTLYNSAQNAGIFEGTKELVRLEKENPLWIQPTKFLIQHYINCEIFDEAERHLDILFNRVKTDQDKVKAFIEKAKLLNLTNKKYDAYHLLIRELNKYSEAENNRLYCALAEMCKNDNDPDGESFYLEEALKCAHDDLESRFRLAFLYSEQNELLLSGHHYKILINQKPNHFTAVNNYGVLLGNLGIKGTKTLLLKKAAKEGEEYAATNLANMLVTIGFYEEASEQLQLLPSHRQDSERVLESKVLIQSHKSEDDKKEDSFKKNAKNYHALISQKSEVETDINGLWKQNANKLEINNENNILSGTYGTPTQKFSVKGKLYGNSSLVLDFVQTEFFGHQHSGFFSGLFGAPRSNDPIWQPVNSLGAVSFKLRVKITDNDKMEAFRIIQNNEVEKLIFVRAEV